MDVVSQQVQGNPTPGNGKGFGRRFWGEATSKRETKRTQTSIYLNVCQKTMHRSKRRVDQGKKKL